MRKWIQYKAFKVNRGIGGRVENHSKTTGTINMDKTNK
jgi:hypothetical protein